MATSLPHSPPSLWPASLSTAAAGGAYGPSPSTPDPPSSERLTPPPRPLPPPRLPPPPPSPLPLFKEVSAPDRPALFLRKLQICSVVYEFNDSLRCAREKETKRQTLLELVDFVQSASARLPDPVQEHLVHTVSANIFRCLPPASHENTGSLDNADPEEEDSYNEPAWPHLHIVYELLLRYIVSSDTDTKIAKRYIDHSFVLRLLDLFDPEDPREREYLKMIVHRIYGKFMVHRPFIRRAINNIFYRFIFETERHAGIGELLEILGSIINGFALPMKEEHKLFLVRALIPLHKPKCVGMYHQQLAYCITQFVEKDYKLADTVIRGLLKYWPVTNCQKEVLFLGELEEVLEATQPAEFQRCMIPLFKQIGRCLNSSHFQLGGINYVLQVEDLATIPLVSRVPTIILGMDVSHGSPGQSDVPSIAAVKCCSMSKKRTVSSSSRAEVLAQCFSRSAERQLENSRLFRTCTKGRRRWRVKQMLSLLCLVGMEPLKNCLKLSPWLNLASIQNRDMERVGRLMESYLAEVASDPNLEISRFTSLVEMIPEQARFTEDGMYRSIDIYLKAHPSLSDMERIKVCGLMECQKLSRETCAHAAQNDRLPVQIVVQVLYHEQQRIREAVDGSLVGGDSPALSQRTTSSGSAYSKAPIDELSRLRTENHDLKLEVMRLKMQLKENQKPSPKASSAEKPPLPKMSFINSVSKKLGRLYPVVRFDSTKPLSGKARTKPPKDRRHSVG